MPHSERIDYQHKPKYYTRVRWQCWAYRICVYLHA